MKIILSLTTISSRINNIHLVIQSLLNQKLPMGCTSMTIILYLSEESFLLDEGIKFIPNSLSQLLMEADNNRLTSFKIEYCPNSGPHRKYIHAFPLLDDNDFLVTLDDDTLYPDDAIQKLIAKSNVYDSIIAMRGRKIMIKNGEISNYRSWAKNSAELQYPSMLNVGTGKDGILYKLSHLHPNVLNIEHALEFACCADDLWLKMHSLLNGTPTSIVTFDLNKSFPDIDNAESNNISLFEKFNKSGGNDVTMRRLDKYLMKTFQTSWIDLCREVSVS